MDMGTTTMAMAATTTDAAAAATSTAISMTMEADCKISMLWNWYTIDACFLSSTWHVTSRSMFAGSCIGVILLVISLEFLRRLSKEYDRYIIRQYQRSYAPISSTSTISSTKDQSCPAPVQETSKVTVPPFRPHIVQQMVRATLHMLQFAVAYFIMLLAMYFNGYIIICIIIGAWIGAFVFSWESVDFSGPQEEATVCCG